MALVALRKDEVYNPIEGSAAMIARNFLNRLPAGYFWTGSDLETLGKAVQWVHVNGPKLPYHGPRQHASEDFPVFGCLDQLLDYLHDPEQAG